jgi:endonuclease YncB( thermonuclease family)
MLSNVIMIRSKSKSSMHRRLADLAWGACLGAILAATAVTALPGRTAAPAGAAAEDRRAAKPAGPSAYRATALAVIDGDTFEARIAAFPGQEIVTRVRIAEIDAPERRARCPAEQAAAEAATRALQRLIENRTLTLTDLRGDKYFGRVLARVKSPGVGDVAEALIAAGHGRSYSGGKRDGWC